MPRRRIDDAEGISAVRSWREARTELPRQALFTAVRWSLEELSALHPGHAVEVRVPPAGVVQCLAGATHRRGTPPAVVETDPQTWLTLVTGELGWAEACARGLVDASGERCDLAPYLPLV